MSSRFPKFTFSTASFFCHEICSDFPFSPSSSAFVSISSSLFRQHQVTKYFVCKQYPLVAYESLECLGGNGYVEDFPMARLYRQAPLNAVWEGSGNVLALDVLRTLAKVFSDFTSNANSIPLNCALSFTFWNMLVLAYARK